MPLSLKNVMCDLSCSIHNLPEAITLQSDILAYNAVMTHTNQLANIGDFVKVISSEIPVSVLCVAYRLIIYV